jgi:multidrug efflux pump subunit AcrB
MSETSSTSGSGHDQSRFIAFFVRHPNAANLVMALMILLGVFGLLRINTQFFPTLDTNVITISVDWRGASAEDAATGILDVIEPEVRFLDNVEEMTGTAREGGAVITLEFTQGADMQKALSDVEQAVAAIDTLPADSETPTIIRAQPYERVAKIAVSGPFEEGALKTFARTIRDRLTDAGIDKVDFTGARDTEYLIEIDPADLRRLDLTVADIAQAIGSNSEDLPSGALDGALERQVRTLGDRETPLTLGAAEIKTLASGERIVVRDLAIVREAPDDRSPRGLSNGEPAIELTVRRTAAADTLEMAEIMRKALKEARSEIPASVKIAVYQIGADRVAQRIGLLVKNGIGGLILVAGILFIFLNGRIAFWVLAGVPISLLAAIGFMFATGQTLNMISLFALIMTLGIIVDDAIVVGEHTATRLAEGDDPKNAAINGATRMLSPVTASILTTAAAFAPILLIQDVIGQIMSALPLVAIAVLVASITECFLVLPAHLAHTTKTERNFGISIIRAGALAALISGLLAALAKSQSFAVGVGLEFLHRLLASIAADLDLLFPIALGAATLLLFLLVERRIARARMRGGESRFRQRFDAGFGKVRDRIIRPIATLSVKAPYATVAACVASFILAFGLLLGGRVPFVFFPSPEAENITANIVFQAGLPEQRALEALQTIENALSQAESTLSRDSGEKLVRASFVVLGQAALSSGPIGGGAGASGDNLAQIAVELTSSEVRTVRTPAVVRAWRDAIPPIPGVLEVAISEARGGPPGRDLDIRISGAEPEVLKAAALEAQKIISSFPGVSGAEDDLPYGKPELGIELTPRGATLGFTAEIIGQQIRDAIDGRIARRIATADEEIEVRVSQAIEGGAGALQALELRSSSGVFVPLAEIANLKDRQGFSVIQRRDGATTVAVTADINPNVTSTGEVIAALKAGPEASLREKYGVRIDYSGRAEEQSKAFGDLRIGAVAALGAIYIIIAWQMASYTLPLAVMAIIPFGFVGALFGHYVMGIPLTILSFIGLLGLSGIVVNDSIILVSRFRERLQAGEAFEDAAIGASCDRLRAVLLTSISTILGLTPLLFETSLQAQFLLPMAVTIVFGIGMATLFVLFLVPALLTIGRHLKAFVGPLMKPISSTRYG